MRDPILLTTLQASTVIPAKLNVVVKGGGVDRWRGGQEEGRTGEVVDRRRSGQEEEWTGGGVDRRGEDRRRSGQEKEWAGGGVDRWRGGQGPPL
jgi:hypothetical protein